MYKSSCIYEYTERIFASKLPYRDRTTKYINKFSKKIWLWWQAMDPHPISLPCTLALPSPSHRDAATPSPCWVPHFMTQERLMFLIFTASKPRSLPPRRWATTCCRLSLRPCTAPLSCSLQPLLKLSLLSLGPSLLQFVSLVSLLLNHGNPIFDICAVPSAYNAIGLLILLKLCPVLNFFWAADGNGTVNYLQLFSQGSPSTSSRQPQTTHVFANSRIALLCHVLCICVEHAPPESCPSFLLVQ